MNSLYNHALKQSVALQRDLEKFASGQDSSAGLQGQISASFSTLQRSRDDYDKLAKREDGTLKKETARTRVSKFRRDLQDMRSQFESIKRQQEAQRHEQNRESLLARRGGNNSRMNSENPYQPFEESRSAFAMRESAFVDSTDAELDSFIGQAQNLLENLTDQHGILKKTQKKLLDAANTLGLSKNVIRYIERRTAQDKWIFFVGLAVTLLILWAISHYLR